MTSYDKINMKIFVTILLIVMLAVAAPCTGAKLSKIQKKEYEIKTAFIYNFLKFIDLPRRAGSKTSAAKKDDPQAKTITVGLIADPEVFEICKVLQGKKVKTKTLRLVRFDAIPRKEIQAGKKSKVLESLRTCNVLFFSQQVTTTPKNATAIQVLTALKNEQILTIGEMPGFIEPKTKGEPCGIFNFLLKDKKIQFEVNYDLAKQKEIVIKAQLLKLAKRVIQTKKDDEK